MAPKAEVGIDLAPGAPSALVAKSFAADAGRARVAGYIGLIAVVLLVTFFSRLYGALRDVSGQNSWLPIMALAGGLLLAGFILFEVGLTFATIEMQAYKDESEVANFFVIWRWNAANLAAPPFAIAILSTTLVSWSTRSFPRWYRQASAVLLVLLLITSGMGTPGLAIAPGMLWMFLTSFVLTLRPKRPVTQTAT